jgi:hypothetical protein
MQKEGASHLINGSGSRTCAFLISDFAFFRDII